MRLNPKGRARFYAPVVALVACMGLAPSGARADAIKVDWNNPELKSFADGRAADVANGIAPEASEDKLGTLNIPVLAFEQPPEAVTRSLRAGPEAEPETTQHFDAENPVWYQIVQDYGDVSVSVSADLRVQHKFPDTHPAYDTPVAPGANVESDEPQVSVMDETSGEGLDGSIAEYTFTRFGVPYTVTIECAAVAIERCKDKEQLAKDSALLKLVGGEAPR